MEEGKRGREEILKDILDLGEAPHEN